MTMIDKATLKRFNERMRKVDLLEIGSSSFIALLTVYFSAPIIALSGFNPKFTLGRYDEVTGRAIVYAMLGIVCFACAYLLTKRKSQKLDTVPRILRYEWNNSRAWLAFIGLFGGGFLIKIARIFSGQDLSSLYISPDDSLLLLKFMISLNALHYMGIAVAFVQYFYLLKKQDPRYRTWMYIAWTTSVVAIAFGLVSITGRLSLITPVLIYLITKQYLHSRNVFRIVATGLLILLVLFPLKMFLRDMPSALDQYFANEQWVFTKNPRHQVYHDLFTDIATMDVLDFYSHKNLNVRPGAISEFATDSTIGRIGQLHVFSAVVEKTNEYLYGRNIPYLFNHLGVPNSMIERVVGIGAGTEFGKKYGIVNESITGVAPTQMGDLYLNFGLAGVLFGMMIFGYLYRKIFEKLAHNPYPSGIFIYSILWIVMLHGLEQSISAAYGRAFQLFLILFVVQFFISCVPLFGKARILDRQSPPA